jgi:hypothetical protein
MQLEQALLGGEPPDGVQLVSVPKRGSKPTAGRKSTTAERVTLIGTVLTGEMELWT